MIRTISSIDKSVRTDVPSVVAVADSVTTDVLSALTQQSQPGVAGEIAGRYIQNVGANDLYFSFGSDCRPDAKPNPEYHGMLLAAAKQQVAINTAERVSVYSIGGTTVATIVQRRRDLYTHENIRGQLSALP